MCFHIRKKDKIETAKKNITVYKVIEAHYIFKCSFYSYYMGFYYQFGKTYKEKNYDFASGEIGFHSYKHSEYKKTFAVSKKLERSIFSSHRRITNVINEGSIIIECIIPKGSNYIFNGTDYISDIIKPVCVILPPKGYLDKYPKQQKILDVHYKIIR